MSKGIELQDVVDPDETLQEFSEIVDDFISNVSEEYAVFALGVKSEEAHGGVQTYINVSGKLGILQEGLYAEIAARLEQGDYTLLKLVKEVIDDVCDSFDIDYEDISSESFQTPALH